MLYIAGKVCYSLSLVVYDSMLVDVTTPERMDALSTKGYAWGYIGSVIPFLISLVFVLLYDKIGITMHTAMVITFLLNAAWWALFTLPLVRGYRQKSSIKPARHIISDSFSRLAHTLRSVKKHRKIFMFLLSFFFYIDGVYTIIDMATAYGASLESGHHRVAAGPAAHPGRGIPGESDLRGALQKKDTATLIKICILAYFFIACFAVQLDKLWEFWFLAFCVGCFQGGIQALSRSYFAKIIPEEQSGEYFGLFDICGKGASFLGLLVVGVVTQATGNQSFGVACITVLFLLGFFLFSKAARMEND